MVIQDRCASISSGIIFQDELMVKVSDGFDVTVSPALMVKTQPTAKVFIYTALSCEDVLAKHETQALLLLCRRIIFIIVSMPLFVSLFKFVNIKKYASFYSCCMHDAHHVNIVGNLEVLLLQRTWRIQKCPVSDRKDYLYIWCMCCHDWICYISTIFKQMQCNFNKIKYIHNFSFLFNAWWGGALIIY